MIWNKTKQRWPRLEKYKKKFKTPNELALALSSDHKDTKFAKEAMRHIIHVKDSLGTYLKNTNNIKKFKNNIFFVGRFEHFSEDFEKLQNLVHLNDVKLKHLRNMTEYNDLKHLDKKAVDNLREWYKKDYDTIRTLIDCSLLPSDYMDEIKNAVYF